MVPVSTYVFIYGVPVFAILFSIGLYIVGGKVFREAGDSSVKAGKTDDGSSGNGDKAG